MRGKPSEVEVGLASWYGPPYAGRKGADGNGLRSERHDRGASDAADGELVRVTNLANNQTRWCGSPIAGRLCAGGSSISRWPRRRRRASTGWRREGSARGLSPPAKPNCDSRRPLVRADRGVQQGGGCDLAEERSAAAVHTAKVIEFAGPTGHWVRINLEFPDKHRPRGGGQHS